MPGASTSKVLRLTALLACVILSSPAARAQQPPVPKRVLVLYWYNKDHPWNVGFDHAFQTVMRSAPPKTVEYFPEYLESNRFPGEKQTQVLHDYLKQKYTDRPIDVVVANSDTSLDFLVKYRADLFPNAAIVFIATRRPPPGRGMTGIVNLRGHAKTVELALKLHPGTRHLYVITGTLEHDKRFEALAREQLRELESRVAITYLTDLPVHELIASMKTLPEHSVLLYVWQQSQDAAGTILESPDIFASIVPSTRVPIYGLTSSIVINGRGAIGGYIDTADAIGAQAAALALRIANGTPAQDIAIEPAAATPMFDWRQLERWGIREDQLPPGAVVRFRKPTFWQLYKWRIVGALSLVLLQAILIVFLLVERRRRRLAMLALDERLHFENLLFELSTELGKVRTNEIDACVARWSERFGTFFQLEEAAFARALADATTDPARLESHELTMRLRVIGEIFSEALTRRQQEKELRTSEERFEAAFRLNPQPMALATLSAGRYLDVNRSFLEISGFGKEEIIGRTSTELGFWSTPADRGALVERLMAERRVRNLEMKFRTKSGAFRDFLISAEMLDLGEGEPYVLTAASDITERKKLEDDLMRLTGRLFHVQDEERRRIARELHDETAQNLFGISLNLAKLREGSATWTAEQIQFFEDCKTLLDVSIRGIRTLSYLLHPPFLDEAGLVSAVQWYVEGFVKRSDIQVELFIEDIGRLDSELETALFRVVQEALTNIHRHSGGARASIRLENRDGEVVLKIRDDGHGMASSSEPAEGIDALGVGIPGMRQRMRQLGGTLEVASSSTGTMVTVTVPKPVRAVVV